MSERRFPFLNRVVVSGLVARKPSIRTNKSGVATLKLSLTVSIPTLSDDMSRKQVSTIRVSVFIVGHLAISCESLLNTGSEIVVEGRLSSPPAHGSVSRLEVHAERIQLIDSNGAVQYLARDFVEQSSSHDTNSDTVNETDSSTGSDSVSDRAKVTSEKSAPVRQRRSVSKRTVSKQTESEQTVSKQTVSEKGTDNVSAGEGSSVASDAKREPRPTRPRRKRPMRSGEAVSEGKSAPRRRRSSVSRVADNVVSQETDLQTTDPVSVSEVDEPIGATVERKSITSRRRAAKPTKSITSRRTEKRSRSAAKGSDNVSVQGKDRDKNKTKDSKTKRPSKPTSDSPFELVETKDSFDPFLLED